MFYSSPSTFPTSGDGSLNGCNAWYQALTDPNGCSTFGFNCLTADWIESRNCFIASSFVNSIGLPPLLGLNGKCAGMVKGYNDFVEGIRATLNANLKKGKYYQLKLRLAVSANSVTNLSGVKIHFTKFSEYWNASTLTSSNVKWENVHTFSIPANSAHMWYDFVYDFRVPNEDVDGGGPDELGNLIIRRDEDDIGGYLFVDDVSLVEVDPCSSLCLEDKFKQPITYNCCGGSNSTIPNAMNTNSPFNFIVDNATEVEFKVWDRWGGMAKRINQVNPNGLKWEFDPANILNGQFDYFRFMWKGDDAQGVFLPLDVYTYQLSMKNCGHTKDLDGNITILGVQERVYSIFDVQTVNTSCCPNQLNIDNVIYSANEEFTANDKILVATSGAVLINNGVEVKYRAGNEIEIGPNFEIASGGLSDIYCSGSKCNSTVYQKAGRSGFQEPFPGLIIELPVKDINEKDNSADHTKSSHFEIIPNPVSDGIFLCAFECNKPDGLFTISIVNSVGKVVRTIETMYSSKNNGILVTGLENMEAGLYFVNIKGNTFGAAANLLITAK